MASTFKKKKKLFLQVGLLNKVSLSVEPQVGKLLQTLMPKTFLKMAITGKVAGSG